MSKSLVAVNAGPRTNWNTDTLISEAVKGAESQGGGNQTMDNVMNAAEERRNDAITILPITKENSAALSLPNEPFLCTGRIVPIFDGKNWSCRTEMFAPDQIREECFPDENYDFDRMGEGFHGYAAYVNGECAGFVLLYEQWNQFLYVDNLLVLKKYRRIGVGSRLIEESMKLAASLDRTGVWLVCQDDNLDAMRFYFANGFELGGMNLPVYEKTAQEGKADLYLYKLGNCETRSTSS